MCAELLTWVAYEEYGGIVAHHVVDAVLREVFDGKAAWIACGIATALLATNSTEANKHGSLLAHLVEELGSRVLGHVVSDLEVAVSASTLGMDDALGDALTVEVGDLVDQS